MNTNVLDIASKDAIEKIKRSIRQMTQKDFSKFPSYLHPTMEEEKITFEHFIIKINEQNNKCYVCHQEFRYDGGNWCYFFPSVDRINNSKPHYALNCAISCFFCNVRMFKKISEKKCTLCDGLCHLYEGEIVTKSELFKSLGNDNYKIHEYIKSLKPDADEE